jgi:NTP pyrophosphatase (non-canonical NTP hydrolase)
MLLNEYQNLAARTANHDLSIEDRITASALGVAGEAGEVADLWKKVRFHGHPMTAELCQKLVIELGDVLFYVADIASALGFDLETVAKLNNEKLRRRYPEGFSCDASLNRDP